MKYLFFVLVGITLFFSLSAGQITPAIVVNHDKLFHFIVFFALSFFMNISFPTYKIKKIVVVMILLAVGIEFAQYYFANRELSVIDFAASIMGIIVYVSIVKIMCRKYKTARKTFNVL